jgi:hypothetical protein
VPLERSAPHCRVWRSQPAVPSLGNGVAESDVIKGTARAEVFLVTEGQRRWTPEEATSLSMEMGMGENSMTGDHRYDSAWPPNFRRFRPAEGRWSSYKLVQPGGVRHAGPRLRAVCQACP